METQTQTLNLSEEEIESISKEAVKEYDVFHKLVDFVVELNKREAQQLRDQGFTNGAFFDENGNLQPQWKLSFKEKKKYWYIDQGQRYGRWLVDKVTGDIWTIKGYGQRGYPVGGLLCWNDRQTERWGFDLR